MVVISNDFTFLLKVVPVLTFSPSLLRRMSEMISISFSILFSLSIGDDGSFSSDFFFFKIDCPGTASLSQVILVVFSTNDSGSSKLKT